MNAVCEEYSTTKEESLENKEEYSVNLMRTKKLVPLIGYCDKLSGQT